jgi:dolichol-phosphate mannosyltransferase
MKNNIEILIPTLNEEGNIEKVVNELKYEGFNNITILDGNSTDKTVDIAKRNGCRVLIDDPSISGFGGSVLNGFKNLKHEYFCIFDGDNSFNPKAISEMLDEIIRGADFVFGTRYLNNTKSDDDTLVTKFGNFFFTKLVRFLFNINTTDVLFLYVVGKTENVEKLKLKQQDFRFCTEFLIKCYQNFNCKEVLSKERKRFSGESKVNKIFDGLKLLINICSIYLKKNEKK